MKIFTKQFYQDPQGYTNFARVIPAVLLGILLIVIVIAQFPFGTVGAGERGIRLRFSAVTGDIINEGLYFRFPFIERVVKIDVKTQKEEADASAASKDLQTVNSKIALNYSIAPESVARLYQTVGIDYKVRLIDPAIQEAVKASTANFTAEELITKREDVGAEIRAHLTEKFKDTGIIVEGFSIIDFDFSKSFNEAIEAKVTAEQNALAAKNKLEQVKYEAQQAVEQANGEAQAIRVKASALAQNSNIIQLNAIEKWDGHLPNVTGGGIPFINIQ